MPSKNAKIFSLLLLTPVLLPVHSNNHLLSSLFSTFSSLKPIQYSSPKVLLLHSLPACNTNISKSHPSTSLALRMPQCGRCRVEKTAAEFDSEGRGSLRRTCRLCLVSLPTLLTLKLNLPMRTNQNCNEFRTSREVLGEDVGQGEELV